jgi:hypothetical protein
MEGIWVHLIVFRSSHLWRPLTGRALCKARHPDIRCRVVIKGCIDHSNEIRTVKYNRGMVGGFGKYDGQQ